MFFNALMMKNTYFIGTTLLALFLSFTANAKVLIHEVEISPGDGIYAVLARYHLSQHSSNLDDFYTMNNLKPEDQLYLHRKYRIPVFIYKYDNKSIRSTINDSNWDRAIRIKDYNELMLDKGLRNTHYTESKILWVPFHETKGITDASKSNSEVVNTLVANNTDFNTEAASKKEVKFTEKEVEKKSSFGTIEMSFLGNDYKTVTIKDLSLQDRVFYVISGHGGPDPGAVCTECEHTLCEDEYAYDVALRLAKNLAERGAVVEVVIQDKNDGIRNDAVLHCDKDEYLANGDRIPINHAKRLAQRTNYVNDKFKYYKKRGYSQQLVVSIHVDSNSKSHKQDVFFCYYENSNDSKRMAKNLWETFEKKYNYHQKDRGYKGHLQSRQIFVLRNTYPPAVLIELANIRNKFDHKRIMYDDNRQALANWIYEGLKDYEIK